MHRALPRNTSQPRFWASVTAHYTAARDEVVEEGIPGEGGDSTGEGVSGNSFAAEDLREVPPVLPNTAVEHRRAIATARLAT